MKVIDLLNKIANGELEDLTHIKNIEHDCEYIYHKKDNRFEFSEKGDWNNYFYGIDIKELNDEVEIIEEDKQIKKIEINYARDIEEKIFYEESDKPNHCILCDAGTELLINKINELIENQNKIIRKLKANKGNE
jgi:hypothetical protein